MNGSKPTQHTRLLRRGGARNRADRVTMSLTEKQCRELIAAGIAGVSAGRPFNRFITISWELGGIDPKDSVSATTRFIAMARDWLRDRSHQLLWAWVQERGPKLGAHCHILLHVPEELTDLFGPMPLRWVKTVLAGPSRRGVLRSDKLRMSNGYLSLSEAIEAEVMGKVHYMLKAAPAPLEARLGMEDIGYKRWGRPCPVYGKRLAVSQSCRRLVRETA